MPAIPILKVEIGILHTESDDMDLGIKPQKGPEGPATVEAPEKYYPMFRLEGDQVDEFLKDHKCKKGDTIECHITLCVTGYSDTKYSKSLEFEAKELCCCDEDEEKEHKPDYSHFAKGLGNYG